MRVLVIILLMCYIGNLGTNYNKLESEATFLKASLNTCEHKLYAKQNPTQKRTY